MPTVNGDGDSQPEPFEKWIFLVEPRTFVRDCLVVSMREAGLSESIRAASTIHEWRELTEEEFLPAAVVLSLSGGVKVGPEIEAQRAAFSQATHSPPVIVLGDDDSPAHVIEILDRGAMGFIPTSVALKVAIEAIRLVLAGGTFIPASSLFMGSSSPLSESEQALSKLPFFTERQLAVIGMLREGKANKVIAHALNMRETTVKVHIRNIMRKLNASNRTQVAYLYQSMISETGHPMAVVDSSV